MAELVRADVGAVGRPLEALWRKCVGIGRAGEALRADVQRHLDMAQTDIGFAYVRSHGIFHDDMMVYRERAGRPVFNWQYVDMVYDHWLSVGARPFVELGFMPSDLASGDKTVFWWKGNVTPPRDWSRWSQLVSEFVGHLIDRYGYEEVSRWYFEVWNEPSLEVFWQGADFDAYMRLYEESARAVKAQGANLKVGGPASPGFGDAVGQPPWGERFLTACTDRGLPLDFFSAHPYPTLHSVDLDGTGKMGWDGPDRLVADLEGTDELLARFGHGGLERHYTEWSSSPSPRDPVHDTAFMAPFVVQNNWRARAMASSLSFWVVSDIFEEGGLGDGPFHGGFGLVNSQGLRKPSYHGYRLLSRLGATELGSGSSYAVTRRDDGTLVVLLWNYCHYKASALHQGTGATTAGKGPADPYALFDEGNNKQFKLAISGLNGPTRVATTAFDRGHGSVYDAWADLGRPGHLRPGVLEALKEQSELVTRVEWQRAGGVVELSVNVAPHGVTLVELGPVGVGLP